MERIVVGVDGTTESEHALRWALAEAEERHDATVEVVHAWSFPEPCRRAQFNLPFALAEQDAASVLGGSVARVRAAIHSPVAIDTSLVEGPPVDVLLSRATSASLLVVGRRQRSRLGRWLHHSVAREVADRATCPVTIVSPGDRW